jgi:hypothetical protein
VLENKDDAESKVREISKFIAMEGRVTTDQLAQRFDLPEKSRLRPLIACLQNAGLIRVGRGFYATSKLIQLVKVLGLPDLPSLPDSGKEGDHQ